MPCHTTYRHSLPIPLLSPVQLPNLARSSASVIVVVKRAVIGCDRIQSNTLADGFGRRASETLVSRTIIRNLPAHALVRVAAEKFLRRPAVRFAFGSHRPSFRWRGESWASTVGRISRTSSSIDRFRWAARTRNLRFRAPSRLRIVMLAILQPSRISMLSL
jgi:hypothetical protein